MNHRTRKTAFSLVELVIVIVIIGVIAAIAVPRISRGAAGAGASALRADLYVLRNSIDLYAAEHNGSYPSGTDATFILQMTTYTDEGGATSATKGDPFLFGPYLVSVPVLKVGEGALNGKGKSAIGTSAASTVGWIYNATLGTVKANSVDAVDGKGVKFDTY